MVRVPEASPVALLRVQWLTFWCLEDLKFGLGTGVGVHVSGLEGGGCSQFENNYFTEMCSGSEAGSYVRLIDFYSTQL